MMRISANLSLLTVVLVATFTPNGHAFSGCSIPSSRIVTTRMSFPTTTSSSSMNGSNSNRVHSMLQMASGTASTDSKVAPPAVRNDGGKKRFAAGMAFLTGWGQVATFLKYQTFSTMMTGNTMWMARALVESRYMDVVYYATIIMSYLLGLAVYRQSDLTLKDKSMAYMCAPLVMGLFVGSDMLMKVLQNRWLPVAMLSAGFGIVNSVGQQVAGTLTFVVTGHYTRLVQQVMDRFSRTAGYAKFRNEGSFIGLAILASFFAGAVTGCATFQTTVGAAFLPKWLWTKTFSILGLSYGALFLWHDREIVRTGLFFRNSE